MVATGSPFGRVTYGGRTPGDRPGEQRLHLPRRRARRAILGGARSHHEMFLIASATLARLVSQERLDVGAIYPHQSELRRVSFEIACAVVRYASEHNLGRRIDPDDVEETVRAAMWDPSYVPVRSPRGDPTRV